MEFDKYDKDKIVKLIKWQTKREGGLGGQSCGIMNPGVTLISEETGIEISIDYYRSQLKNKELAFNLFQLALSDIIK
jgi:protein subunit release factor B